MPILQIANGYGFRYTFLPEQTPEQDTTGSLFFSLRKDFHNKFKKLANTRAMEANDQIAAALASSAPVIIGKWTFHADSLLLKCGENSVKLEPRVAYLLYYLTEKAGIPVSRADLTDHVWSGMVVGDEALTTAINKLRNAFGDDSHHPEVIKTIPKVGYQLIADVEFSRARGAVDNPAPASGKKYAITGFALIIILVFVGTLFLVERSGAPEESIPGKIPVHEQPDKPSIAVLPFTNLSKNSEQEYFVEGITEDVITDLSKLSGLFVIARNSVSTYKDETLDFRQIAKELGVSHVLRGSVRRDKDQLRISAQLIRADNGEHLWADRYDRQLQDIFSIQDEIAANIVQALKIELGAHESEALISRATANFDAYDLFLRGQQISVNFSEEAITEAIEIYQQAIRLDPDYAHAYGALAVARIREYFLGFADIPARSRDRALELARKAAAMDPGSQQIQWSLGYIHMYRKEFDDALAATERSISLAPNYADAYALLALIKNNLGQADDVIPLIEKAMQLNPHYTWDYIYQLGRAYYALNEYEKAISYLQEAIGRNEAVGIPRLFLAACYVNLGLLEEAEWEITELQISRPYFTYTYVQQILPLGDTELFDRFFRDLRTAGFTD